MMKRAAFLVAGLALAALTIRPLGAAEQTLTGEISDSACNFKHESGQESAVPPPAAECRANCLRGGSTYTLLVDKKIYQITNQTVAGLKELGGMKVKVTGDVTGDKLTIAKIEKAQ